MIRLRTKARAALVRSVDSAKREPVACAATNQRLLDTVVKVVDRLVPTAVTAPMITTAISAAIKPYSIAVAPLWFLMKRANVVI